MFHRIPGRIRRIGSAASKNVGTAAGNLVMLDAAAKLPAVDGSQLTGISAGSVVTSIAGNTGAFTLGTGLTNSTNNILVANGVELQTVYAELTTWTTGTTSMALGLDTIPQITDGTELVTVSITPKLSTTKLLITISGNLATSAASASWAAVFQDTTANAVVAVQAGTNIGADLTFPFNANYQMTSGTTSSTTFRLRVGLFNGGSGSWAVNGTSAGRRLGGSQRAVIKVVEVKA